MWSPSFSETLNERWNISKMVVGMVAVETKSEDLGTRESRLQIILNAINSTETQE